MRSHVLHFEKHKSWQDRDPCHTHKHANTCTCTRRWIRICLPHIMMTSSNGNIFRVTGHLCGKFTGPRWISRTKASDAEIWCFFIYASINDWVNNREAGDLKRQYGHYDVIVLCFALLATEAHEAQTHLHIDGLMRDWSISIANALEILQSWTKPYIYATISLSHKLVWKFQQNSGHFVGAQ